MGSGPKPAACLLVLAAIGLAGCENTQADAPLAETGRRIAGGEPTGYERWQGVIGLFFPLGNNRRMECTATLVAPDIALSAGHCVYWPSAGVDATADPENLAAVGGPNMWEIQYARAKQVVLHPLWRGDVDDLSAVDLALILLKEPIPAIPHYDIYTGPLEEGETGKIVGYGAAALGDDASARVHRVGDTTVLRIEDGRLLELGDPSSTCVGDSGGPFLVEEDGAWLVAAVTSFGDQETACQPDQGGYSVALYPYLDWIDETLRELSGQGLDLETDSGGGCRFAPEPRRGTLLRSLL